MNRLTWGALTVAAILIFSEASASAQYGAPGMGGTGVPGVGGGMGTATQRPRRRLRRNQLPALSPALNLVPGAVTSFEGQFLLRQLPQEQVNRNTTQFNRQIQGLQNQVNTQETEIKTGIGKTGHATKFMQYGSYYSFGGAGGHRGQ
jgi:hypothetical protein